MVEKLAQDSAQPLDKHARDLTAAIASAPEAVTGGATGGPSPSADNPALNETITSSFLGPKAAAALAVADDLNSKPNSSESSFFVGGGARSRAARVSTPIVPPSYGEKKAAARVVNKATPRPANDLFGRVQNTGHSLNGTTSTSARPVPIKGASVPKSAAAALSTTAELRRELDATVELSQGTRRFNSKKRLEDELVRGVDGAEQTVQRKPELLKPV